MSASDFFRQLSGSLGQLEREIADIVIAVEAENFHADNFRNEGFTDRGLKKWPKRKRKLKKARSLLVDSTALKGHAIKGRVRGSFVDFVFPKEYMRVHNEGGVAGRRNARFKMPKRKYVGESYELEQRIKRKAIILLNRRFNRR